MRDHPATAGEMDTGPLRILPQHDPGTGPVLGRGNCAERRCCNQGGTRRLAARSRRLHGARPERAVCLRHRAAPGLQYSRIPPGRLRGAYQQGAGHAGARRGTAPGSVRDGTAAGPGGRQIIHRSGRSTAPQPGQEGTDALPQVPAPARRYRSHPGQRRLPGNPGTRPETCRLGFVQGTAAISP